jgi:hypothetical protein
MTDGRLIGSSCSRAGSTLSAVRLKRVSNKGTGLRLSATSPRRRFRRFRRTCSPAPSYAGSRRVQASPGSDPARKRKQPRRHASNALVSLCRTRAHHGHRLRQDRISFHENGVVSLNLPPVGNVLSTRATRTTHPRTLALFSKLFSRVSSRTIRIDNPSFWKTKTEVMETIGRLGGADLIGISASCADTHNRTTQHPHCGRCSQCIDRRFAALASGLDLKDPAEAYALDLMEGVRTDARDREIALSYVRNALFFESASPSDLLQHFPALLQGLDRLGEPTDTTLKRISGLLGRHGRAVTSVMRETQKSRSPEQWPDGCLPRLFGEVQLGAAIGLAAVPNPPSTSGSADRLLLVFDQKRKNLLINDVIEITGAATYGLLRALAEHHLEAAGRAWRPRTTRA